METPTMRPTLRTHLRSARPSAHRLLAAIGLAITLAGLAHAQDLPMPRVIPPLPAGMSEPTNAALLYGRALRKMKPESLEAMVSTDDSVPSAEAAAALKENAEALEIVVKGSLVERCEWGIEYSQGPYANVDHAGPMRSIVRSLHTDAKRRLLSGDRGGAAEDVAAMLRIAEHTTQDRIMISSLVGMAMTKVATNRINQMLDADQVDRTGAKVLLEAARRLDGVQGFRMVDALRTEKWMACDWLRAACNGPDAGAKVVQSIGWMTENNSDELLKGMQLLNEQQMATHFDGIARAYDDIIAAWDRKDASPELKRIYDAAAKGEYGLIGQAFVPDVSKARLSTTDANDAIRDVIKRLEKVK